MKNNGWVKLHRKILDNPVVTKDGCTFTIFVYLLLMASSKTVRVVSDGRTVELKPGQLIISRRKIGKFLRISDSKVQRVLDALENDQIISQKVNQLSDQQMNHPTRVITITNWGVYQGINNNSEPVSEPQSEHYTRIRKNNNKKIKEKNKILTLLEVEQVLKSKDTIQLLTERFGNAFQEGTDIQDMMDWLGDHAGDGKNLSGRKNPVAFARNWIKRKVEYAKQRQQQYPSSTGVELTARQKALQFHGLTETELTGGKNGS